MPDTIEQLAREIADKQHAVTGALWSAAYVAAKAALLEGERRGLEKAAGIADDAMRMPDGEGSYEWNLACHQIAQAIRSAKP